MIFPSALVTGEIARTSSAGASEQGFLKLPREARAQVQWPELTFSESETFVRTSA